MPGNKKKLSEQPDKSIRGNKNASNKTNYLNKKLKDFIEIPDDFSSEKVEIIIFSVLPADTEKTNFKSEQFFGVGQLEHIDQLLATMRDEWEH